MQLNDSTRTKYAGVSVTKLVGEFSRKKKTHFILITTIGLAYTRPGDQQSGQHPSLGFVTAEDNESQSLGLL